MNLPIPHPFQTLSNRSTEKALRAIVFNVSEYVFAMPIGAVDKIVVSPPIINNMERGIGIVNLGSQTITVLDLRYKFDRNFSEQSISPSSCRFLILTKIKNGEICGILVCSPPFLTDIPLSSIQPIPNSYREVMGLDLTSYMAILPRKIAQQADEKDSQNIFILGMEQILVDLT